MIISGLRQISSADFKYYSKRNIIRNDLAIWPFPSGSRLVTWTGRSAIAHLMKLLDILPGNGVLMPAYIAEGVIQPFLNKGIHPLFYQLDEKLRPDLDDLDALVKEHGEKIKLMILVHPMGYPVKVEPIRACFKGLNVHLLEDCALAMFSTHEDGTVLGGIGDSALFSFNKFLPVLDGALLISNKKDLPLQKDVHYEGSVSAAMDAYFQHLLCNYRLGFAASSEEAASLSRESAQAYDSYYEEINKDLRLREMSLGSKAIFQGLDFEDLAGKRKRNARYICEFLLNPEVKLLYGGSS